MTSVSGYYGKVFSVQGSVPLPGSRLLAFPVDLRQPVSTTAYLITREACERMTKSLLPVRTVADDWYQFYQDGLLDRVRCVEPRPVSHDCAFPSTVNYVPPEGLARHLREAIKRSRLPGLHQAVPGEGVSAAEAEGELCSWGSLQRNC